MDITRSGHHNGLAAGTAVTASIATCREIIYQGASSGMVYIPAGSSVTSLTPYVAYERGGTYYPLYDEYGAPVVMTVVHTRAYPIPVAPFGAMALKFLSNETGVVHVSLKG
jgi:hypothetical protein